MTQKEKLQITKACREAGMKANPSSIERMIWKILDELKIGYRIQVPFDRFTVDIYFSAQKVIIECNRDWWHNYKIFPKRKIRDDALQKYADRNGYKIIWLWEYEIRKDARLALENGFKMINIGKEELKF